MSSEPRFSRQSLEVFEFRLEGGKLFQFGPPRPGEGGRAYTLRTPPIFRHGELAPYFSETARVQWEVRPIDKQTRREFAEENRDHPLIDIGAISKGAAFLWLSGGYGHVFIDVWLPMTDVQKTGLSTYEDWLRILASAKDDLNREALLRLSFDPRQLQPTDIEAFRRGARLATADVELPARPRAIQWAQDKD
jgi:hypothetical protein